MNRWIRTARSIVTSFALLAMVGALAAQAPQTAPPRGAGAAPGSLPETSSAPVTQAIEMNSTEIELAKTASTKAQDAKVKAFAEMMIKDHTQAMTKLQNVDGASTPGKNLSPKNRDAEERLSKLSGAEFDREYMDTMVKDHQAAVEFFEKQSKLSTSAGNNSMAKVSQELLPTIRKHLDEAQKIQKELANPKPGAKANAPDADATDAKSKGNSTYSAPGTVPNNPPINPTPNRTNDSNGNGGGPNSNGAAGPNPGGNGPGPAAPGGNR